MYSTRQVGSLAVVEETREKQAVQADLTRLDPNLFLDAEIDLEKRFVWTVKLHLGSAVPPQLLFEWRDTLGNPLPLSSGLIERCYRIEGTNPFQLADDHNRKLRERREREAQEEYQEIAKEMEKHLSETRSAVLPRSVALRMSRDKRRGRGEKI